MNTVLTIGYTQKSLRRFVRLLREAEVDAVIDVRLRNTSQLAGFSKRDDLAFILEECLGIGYEHLLELAPTDEMLDAIKSGSNWSSYEQEFRELLTDRNAVKLGRELLTRHQRPCLLCAEPHADQCHRRLIAEWWSEQIGDVEIVHL